MHQLMFTSFILHSSNPTDENHSKFHIQRQWGSRDARSRGGGHAVGDRSRNQSYPLTPLPSSAMATAPPPLLHLRLPPKSIRSSHPRLASPRRIGFRALTTGSERVPWPESWGDWPRRGAPLSLTHTGSSPPPLTRLLGSVVIFALGAI